MINWTKNFYENPLRFLNVILYKLMRYSRFNSIGYKFMLFSKCIFFKNSIGLT